MFHTPHLKISVIMPTYNAVSTIRESIESILAQTYPNFELIIIDDGSIDGTQEIVREFNDSRIFYFYQKNKGVAIARNAGLRRARGEFVTFLDADDTYLPKKLEYQINFLSSHPEYDIAYCGMIHFSSVRPSKTMYHRGPFPSGDIFPQLITRFFCQLNTVLIPKKIFEHVGYFDENFRDSEEWDLLIRIARAGYRFGYLEERLVKIKMDDASLSKFENQWKMKMHNLDFFLKLFTSLSSEERKRYNTEMLYRRLQIKLAIAFLAAGKKQEFFEVLNRIEGASLQKLSSLLLYFIPSSFIQKCIIFLWKRKQSTLYRVMDIC